VQDSGADEERGGGLTFARLRERTDELELIISGLTMVVLFVTPTLIYQQYGENHLHYSYTVQVVMRVILVVLPPLCYGLAACFTVHLCSRAYWIGLIGLQNVFPQGINWDNRRLLGPISRRLQRDGLPDLGSSIKRADRMASSLFAIISLLGLVVLWWIVLFAPLMFVMATIGGWVGASVAAVRFANWAILVLIPGSVFSLWLLDAVLARHFPALTSRPGFMSLVRAVHSLVSALFLLRLITNQKLVLQSNTWPMGFGVLLVMVTLVMLLVGPLLISHRFEFAPFGDYRHMDSTMVGQGFRSSHYEQLRTGRDALLIVPMIPADMTTSSYLRVFLPYSSARDNLALRQQCQEEASLRPGGCLRKLWQVELNNGASLDMEGFMPAERRDLGMRGLLGYVPLHDLRPGAHELRVTWTPLASMAGISNDFIPTQPVVYRIPFVFAPDYELEITLD